MVMKICQFETLTMFFRGCIDLSFTLKPLMWFLSLRFLRPYFCVSLSSSTCVLYVPPNTYFVISTVCSISSYHISNYCLLIKLCTGTCRWY
jgi:hypothetical protein